MTFRIVCYFLVGLQVFSIVNCDVKSLFCNAFHGNSHEPQTGLVQSLEPERPRSMRSGTHVLMVSLHQKDDDSYWII